MCAVKLATEQEEKGALLGEAKHGKGRVSISKQEPASPGLYFCTFGSNFLYTEAPETLESNPARAFLCPDDFPIPTLRFSQIRNVINRAMCCMQAQEILALFLLHLAD